MNPRDTHEVRVLWSLDYEWGTFQNDHVIKEGENLSVYMTLSKMETPGSKEDPTGLGRIHKIHSDIRTEDSTKEWKNRQTNKKHHKTYKGKIYFLTIPENHLP